MKKINAFLPFWFILMVPPLCFVTLGFDFILCGIGLMFVLFIINVDDAFTKYSKNVFKLFWISVEVDIIAFALMFGLDFLLHGNKTMYEKFTYPLEHNPYTSIWTFIFVILLFIFLLFISYNLIKKKIINKIDEEIIESIEIENKYKRKNKKEVKGIDEAKKKNLSMMLSIFVIPYLFFVPSSLFLNSEKSKLEDFKGTLIGDKTGVVNVMNHLNVTSYIDSYVLETKKEPYTINIFLNSMDYNYIKAFEADAAVMFDLIKDVNEINFIMDNRTYNFDIIYINNIYGDIHKTKLTEINDRYKSYDFEEYIYMGHVNEYDIFDMSSACEEEAHELFEYKGQTYYLICSNIDDIKLYDGKDYYTLKDALKKKLIKEEDLFGGFLELKNDADLIEDSNK